MANRDSDNVTVLDGAGNKIIDPDIEVGARPLRIDVDSEHNRVYVVNRDSNNVTIIDGNTNTFIKNLDVGKEPRRIAVNTRIKRVYVANFLGNSVTVINGATDELLTTVDVGAGPRNMAVDLSTKRVYVVDREENSISIIDGTDNTVIDTLDLGEEPRGIGVNSTTGQVYVTNFQSDTVSVIGGPRKVIFILGINTKGYPDSCMDTPPDINQFNNLGTALKDIVPKSDIVWFSYNFDSYCDPGIYQQPKYSQLNTCDGIDKAEDELERLVGKLIEQSPDVKLNIVAHSMGGLVAAYWASQKRKQTNGQEFLRKHIHSIITLDSPLNGSAFADVKTLGTRVGFGWVCDADSPSVEDIDTKFGKNSVLDEIFQEEGGSNTLTSLVNFVHVNSTAIAGDLLPGYWRDTPVDCGSHHCMLKDPEELKAVAGAILADVYDDRSNFEATAGSWEPDRGSSRETDDEIPASFRINDVVGRGVRVLYTGEAAAKVRINGGTPRTLLDVDDCVRYPYGHDGIPLIREPLCQHFLAAPPGTYTVDITTIPECRLGTPNKFTCVDPRDFFFDALEALPPLAMLLEVNPPVNVLLPGPDGRRLGFDPATEMVLNEIPDATFSGTGSEPQVFSVPTTLPGEYELLIVGTGEGEYHITVETVSEGGFVESTREIEATATVGSEELIEFDVAPEGVVTISPPIFDVPPNPDFGTGFTVTVGDTVGFTIQASDLDAEDIVSVNAPILPAGSSFGCDGPGNPTTCTFQWIPAVGDVGLHTLRFNSTDEDGDSAPYHVLFVTVENLPSKVDVRADGDADDDDDGNGGGSGGGGDPTTPPGPTVLETASGTLSSHRGGRISTGIADPVEASVEMPPDALDQDIGIRIESISAVDTALPTLSPGTLSRVFRFSPGGQQFLVPVALIISYKESEVGGLDESTLSPLLLTGDGWVPVENCVADDPLMPDPCFVERDMVNSSLLIHASHFSIYAVQASFLPMPSNQVATGLMALGGNLVRVWHFNNATKEWPFYDPRPAFADSNTQEEMVPGEAYYNSVDSDQATILNGDAACLRAGILSAGRSV